MREVVTDIEIDAPPEQVWRVLSDTAAWPQWNPLILSFDGALRVGAKVRFKLRLGSRDLPVDARVLRADPSYGIRWVGPALRPMRGLARGEHYFEIQPRDGSGTRFVHGEQFSGPLFELPWRWLEPQLQAGYRRMNEALKERVESARS